MVCGISIIQYVRCKHSILFKLGCTRQCDALCPPELQRTLLLTKSLWLCEDCHLERWFTSADARAEVWDAVYRQVETRYHEGMAERMQRLPDAQSPWVTPVSIEALNLSVHRRFEDEDRRLEKARVAQVEELQLVADWTFEYGRVLWDLENGQGDAGETMARVQSLRELQKWDLIVVRDVSRTSEELRAELGKRPAMLLKGATSTGANGCPGQERLGDGEEGGRSEKLMDEAIVDTARNGDVEINMVVATEGVSLLASTPRNVDATLSAASAAALTEAYAATADGSTENGVMPNPGPGILSGTTLEDGRELGPCTKVHQW